jgi:sugar phosphate isomerase/epimerase
MSGPLVGFSMHPLWAEGKELKGFLEPLQAAGLAALEFTLDPNDDWWPHFEPLMHACAHLGVVLSFHAPYLPPYTVAGFDGDRRAAVEADYGPMLDIAGRYGPAVVVLHGPESETRGRDALAADTVAFFNWGLSRYPRLDFALENLVAKQGVARIGDDRAEMERIVRQVEHARLGFCWDMGHDIKDDRPVSGLDAQWMGLVRHVHVHDVNWEGDDHYPLVHGRVPYAAWLADLIGAGFGGIVSLEIKGHQLEHLGRVRVRELLRQSIAKIARALEQGAKSEGER